MKYIVCKEPGDLHLKNREEASRGVGEALLQLRKVGVCGTDLHAYAGNQPYFTYPRILGHELAATVLEIGNNADGIVVGDQVIPIPYVNCDNCVSCKAGKTNCCEKLQVLGVHTDGGMQERFSIPASLLIKTNQLSFDQMAIAEPLAIGAHAIGRADILENVYVLVMGCGPIGIGIISQAQLKGAKVIALDVNDERLQFVKDHFEVQHIVNAIQDPLKAVLDITKGNLAQVVFDATGNKFALESGPQYMSHGGKFVLVGLSKESLSFSHPAIHAKEMAMLCSRNATREDFNQVIHMLEHDLFPVDSYITHRAPFGDVVNQFDFWTNPKNGVVKAVIEL